MLIVYYKEADGKIYHHHRAPQDMSELELRTKLDEYNSAPNGGGRTAHIANIEDGTLEGYLFGLAELRYTAAKEVFSDAINALENAKESILDLQINTVLNTFKKEE